jgi:hypothetical protein
MARGWRDPFSHVKSPWVISPLCAAEATCVQEEIEPKSEVA